MNNGYDTDETHDEVIEMLLEYVNEIYFSVSIYRQSLIQRGEPVPLETPLTREQSERIRYLRTEFPDDFRDIQNRHGLTFWDRSPSTNLPVLVPLFFLPPPELPRFNRDDLEDIISGRRNGYGREKRKVSKQKQKQKQKPRKK